MNRDLIKQVMDRLDAPAIVERLNALMQEEHARRLSFYEWIDEHTKAEFVNGQVVIHSPAKKKHLTVTKLLSRLISFYCDYKNLGETFHEKAMIALTRNDYEPDIVFFNVDKAAAFTPDQVLFPAPDLAVEVLSKKTEKIDRVIKKADYAAHGVREYWIIDPNKQIIEQYLLVQPTDTSYFEQPFRHGPGDEISSKVIPGFTIPVQAIFDEKANVAALQALMAGA